MPDDPESGQTGGRDVRVEARASIETEVRQADTQERKVQLGENLKQELRDAKTPAETYLTGEALARAGARMTTQDIRLGNEVLRSIIRASEAAKRNIPISQTTEGQALLTKLAEKSLDPSTAASIEINLADYLIGRRRIMDPGGINPEFKQAFDDLRSSNPIAARLVSESLIDVAGREIPALTESEAKDKFEVKEVGRKEQAHARGSIEDKREADSEKFEQWVNKFNAYYKNLPGLVKERLRPKVEEQVKRKYEGKDLAKISAQLNLEINQELERQLAEKLSKFYALNKAINNTESGREQILRDYRDNMLGLYNDGLLRENEYKELLRLGNELSTLLEDMPKRYDRNQGGLREQLLRHHRIPIKEKHERIVDALGDIEQLKELLRSEEYRVEGSPDEINFKKFYDQVKEVAEDILSIINLDPGQFFEQAFNPFYQGSGYIIFTDAIRTVGQELSKDKEFSKKKGRFYDIRIRENLQEQGITPKESTPYIVPVTMEIDELITRVLTNRVISLRNIYEYLHNTELIVDEGRGFETLAQYAEKVNPADLDWFLYEDKDLAAAYNFYIQNIRQELYLEKLIMTPEFGKRDLTGLDIAQQRTLAQMKAIKAKEEKSTLEGTEKGAELAARLIRKIRQAGGLTKGYTGEYWVLLLTAYLPMKYEKYVDKDGEKYRFKPTFKSGGESGPEKMATQINPEATWIRFGIPAHLPVLPYVYQGRDLDKYEPWDHTTVYKLKKEREDSYIAGATPWYLDFAKKHIRLGEHLRYQVVGAYLRGTWRIEGYKGFISFKKDKEGKVTNYYDFYKTIGNLMTVGPYALKTFFDNLDVGKIDAKTIEEMLGVKDFATLAKSRREKLVREDLKEACYKEFLFQWMFDVAPTKVLGFERREFTPKGENLVVEELWEMLIKKYGGFMPEEDIKTKLTPLFVDALELVARNKLKSEANEDAFLTELEGITSIDKFRVLLDKKKFSEADLTSTEANRMLRALYDSFKTIIAESSYQGKKISLEDMSFEEFKETLPKFLTIISDSLKRRRAESGIEKGKNDIDLIERFMFWEKKKLYFAEFGGEDLDISRMFFQGAGRRMPARYMGETQNVAKAFTENIQKYYDSGTAAMAKTNTEHFSRDEFDRFITEKIAPPLVEIKNALANIDMSWADEFAVRHTIFFNRIVERDHRYRMVGLGGLRGSFERRSTGRQESLIQDHFVSTYDRPTYSLDADNSEGLCRALLNATEVPWIPTNIAKAGYTEIGGVMVPDIYEYEIDEKTKLPIPVYEEKEFKFFGKKLFTYKAPKLKEQAKNKWNAQLAKISEGHVFKNKIIDRYLPIAIFVLFLIMLQLGWAAKKKNEAK